MRVATHEDLVNRKFSAASPNRLWLTDVTEHNSREGTLYCCFGVRSVLSLRRRVGDRPAPNGAVLVNDALLMAARSRATSRETILHSDCPDRATSRSRSLRTCGTTSCSARWVPLAIALTAPMESFWGSMQIELLNRKKWLTSIKFATAMADYIVNFYNLRRVAHSSLDPLT